MNPLLFEDAPNKGLIVEETNRVLENFRCVVRVRSIGVEEHVPCIRVVTAMRCGGPEVASFTLIAVGT